MTTTKQRVARAKPSSASATLVDTSGESAVGATATPIESAISSATDTPNQPMEKMMAFTKESFDKAQAATRKSYDELTVFGKDNMDAVVKAGQIYAKGMEQVSRAVISFSQAQVEQTVAVTKAVMGSTTLRQVMDIQKDFAKTAVDKTIAESTKVSELVLKVANETFEPIQARVTVAVEKMKKPLAA